MNNTFCMLTGHLFGSGCDVCSLSKSGQWQGYKEIIELRNRGAK